MPISPTPSVRYTSFTALTSFYVFGLVLEDYAVALLVLGFVVTFVGQVIVELLVDQLPIIAR